MMQRNKYGNRPCEANGEQYRSKRERDRHQELQLLMFAGEISDLRREVPYVLALPVKIGDERTRPALRYYADFVYRDNAGREIVEDCKGVRTQVYRLKRHLMATVLGIEVQES